MRPEITVVFMSLVAQLALLAISEDHAWNRRSVIEDLKLVEVIINAFTVVLNLVGLEERFVFCLEHGLLIVARGTALRLLNVALKNDGAEELEYTFFDLAKRQFFVEDEDARLGQRLGRAENHVARPLLRDHDLNWHELTRVSLVRLALKRHKVEARD